MVVEVNVDVHPASQVDERMTQGLGMFPFLIPLSETHNT